MVLLMNSLARIFNRQLVLINLIMALNEKQIKSRRAIVKGLFLLKKEYSADDKVKFYSFYPYQQGPFSGLSYSDLRKLKEDGLVDADETALTPKANLLPENKLMKLEIYQMMSRFENEKQMLDYVYANYPEYAVKSKLIKHQKEETKPGFFSIGYEGRDIDYFLNLLIQNRITLLVDVRKNAFSMNFCFTKKSLNKFLNDADIQYIHFSELGVESEDRQKLETPADYQKLFKNYRASLPSREAKINELKTWGEKERVAFMCFENDHHYCHRGQIAEHLEEQGIKVTHL